MDMNNEMSLRETIKTGCGVDLPISGGFGQDINDLIVIETDKRLFIAAEHAVIKHIFQLLKAEYKIVEQQLVGHGDKKVDVFILESKGDASTPQKLYFDVTRFVGAE